VDYLPTDDVTGMHIIMAAVDELVTLLDGQHPSRWLSYSPLPTFVEAADWRLGAGMIHEPAHRRSTASRAASSSPAATALCVPKMELQEASSPAVPVVSLVQATRRPAQDGLAQGACRGTAVDLCVSYVGGKMHPVD
jgi:hypothetical protein